MGTVAPVNEDVRRRAIDLLAQQGDHRFGPGYLPQRLGESTECSRDSAYAALWGLVGDGLAYLVPRQGSGPDEWRFELSPEGRRVAAGGTWEPTDPGGFRRRLLRRAPRLDPGALVYLDESLRAFNAGCYLSSSVMLGVAAEKVFLGLASSVVAALPGRTAKLDKALNNPRASQNTRFDELRNVLNADRASLPAGLADPLTFDAVADLLRVTRNDAGHPTGTVIDEDTARVHLAIAGGYLAKLTALREHFEHQVVTASPASAAAP